MVCLHPLAALCRLERHELCLCVHVRAEHAEGARRKIDVELRVAVHIVELPKLALLSSAAHTCALDQARQHPTVQPAVRSRILVRKGAYTSSLRAHTLVAPLIP